jgi:phosphoadenosine phosphosulfate reductase
MTQSIEPLTQPASLDLKKLNQRFDKAHPKDILAWCTFNIPTGLVQTSAFNVDDMLITDLLYRDLRPAQPVPVLFLDTLHHFPQTLELVAAATDLYQLNLQVYKIRGVDSRAAFAATYGDALWTQDINRFSQLTKIEPLQRGLQELQAIAWITGRRRDQATTRSHMPIFELDQQQRLKVNPLANWTRKETWAYVFEHDVIYNPLHDQGYPSIGDEPITVSIREGDGERAGRWQDFDGKTECGIHLP